MTPQKVFQENVHFLLLPVILVALKFLWEAVGPLLFVVILAAAYGVFLLSKQYKQKQSERTAKQLEDSADSFIAELTKDEDKKKRKEQSRKVHTPLSSVCLAGIACWNEVWACCMIVALCL